MAQNCKKYYRGQKKRTGLPYTGSFRSEGGAEPQGSQDHRPARGVTGPTASTGGLSHTEDLRASWGGVSFPGPSDGKESACNARDPGWIPGVERSPGEGNGDPLQYSCLENSMDRGAWRATAHGVAKSRTRPTGRLSQQRQHRGGAGEGRQGQSKDGASVLTPGECRGFRKLGMSSLQAMLFFAHGQT